MRFFCCIVLALFASNFCKADECITLLGPKKMNVAVRVSAIQLVVRSGDYLQISTGNQLIRFKLDQATERPVEDIDVTLPSYLAIVHLIDGKTETTDGSKQDAWLEIAKDKTKSGPARLRAVAKLIEGSSNFVCSEIEVSPIQLNAKE